MNPGESRALFDDLYSEIILDHNRRPRNFGRLPRASHSAAGHNPLCGDKVTVDVRVANGRIEDIAFEGVGCAISTASASLMTEALRGKTLAEARQLFERFHALVTTGAGRHAGAAPTEDTEDATAEDAPPADFAHAPAAAPGLGKLAAFSGVREFPMRVKCATLAWHALQSALASPPAREGET